MNLAAVGVKKMATVRRFTSATTAPQPGGPFSQAVTVGNTVYVSGVIGKDLATNALISDDVKEQTDLALKNMGEVLKCAGSSFDKVVKTTVLLADIKDYADVNSVYTKYFVSKYPARAAYQVAALPRGAKVEIEAIAVVGDIIDEN